MTEHQQNFAKHVDGLRCAAVTDVGMRRANNQDAMAVVLAHDHQMLHRRGHLFLVADGMGAHAAGELASQIAAENVPHAYHKNGDLGAADALAGALRDANARIHAKGQNSVDFQGMGTTCSCLAVLPSGALVGHVGDSRVYRLRGDVLEQLTFDHSLVWEMAQAGQASEEEVPAYVPKNVITRSLGPNSTVKVDLEGPLAVLPGDRYLLCSDGLSGPLSTDLLGLVLSALSPDDAAQTLVDLANLLGGPDNITVVVAEVTGAADNAAPTAEPFRRRESRANGDAELSASRVAGIAAVLSAAGGVGALAAANPMVGGALLAVAGLAGAAALLLRRGENDDATSPPRSALQGRAPYRRYRISPGPEHIDTLSDIVRQLEDLESQRTWPFDWSDIHADRQEAYQAISRGDFRAATVAYCSAVRRLMKAVRDSTATERSDSSIRLGED